MTTKPQDLTAGTRFLSPRKEEGIVKVICDYGKCSHDASRDESVHVRGTYESDMFGMYQTEFFINLPAHYPIEEWGAEMVKQ